MNPDRNLLFGLLALQNDFIDRKQLIAAFGAWVADREDQLSEILLRQQAVDKETKAVLERLVDQHIKIRGTEENCLATLSVDPFVKSDLDFLADTEIQHSIACLTRASSPNTAAVSKGSSNNRFLIIRPLDRGGLGIVSVAKDNELNREVALKEIRDDRADDEHLRQKFLLEAEVTGGLEHPGIVPVYALGQNVDGRPYYAMRLIRGENLRTYIRRFHEGLKNKRFSYDGQELRKLLRRFLDICEAISYAHARGVVHRDLKPGNIMLGQYGETLVVDWGLAKALGTSGDPDDDTNSSERSILSQPESPLLPSGSHADETRQGAIVGTPAYAAPEQLTGDIDRMSPLSDVYGLGAILYEILTGQPPASGTIDEVLKNVIAGNIPACREVQPLAPKPLEAICLKAIATQPDARFRSAKQLAAEVERWLDDTPIASYTEPWPSRLRRWARKHPAIISTTAAIAGMTLLGLSAYSALTRRNNEILATLNSELANTNQQLAVSNTELKVAKDIAQDQSQLALTTLNSVVTEIQNGMRNIPGGAEVRRRILSSALEKLQDVASEIVSQSSIDRSTMVALGELGTIVSRFGNAQPLDSPPSKTEKTASEVARELLEKSHAIAIELSQLDPTSTRAKLDLAQSFDRLGMFCVLSGSTTEAEQLIQSGLELRESLLQADPQNSALQSANALSQYRLGEVVLKLRKAKEAFDLFNKSLATRRAIQTANPTNTEANREVSYSLQSLASASRALGQTDEAIEYLIECIEIREKLLSSDPTHLTFQRDTLLAHDYLADLYSVLGETQKGMLHSEKEMALSRAVVQNEPDDIQGQLDLAVACDQLGALKINTKNFAEGIQYLEEALAIRRKLISLDPKNSHLRRQLSISLDRLGREMRYQGRLDDALVFHREALESAQLLAEADPKSNVKQRDLSISYNMIGDVLVLQGDYTNALENFKTSSAIAESLAAADPDNFDKQRDKAIVYSKMGRAYGGLQQHAKAIEYLQQGLAIDQLQLDTNPQNPTSQRNVALWHELIADANLQAEDYESALVSFKKSCEMRQVLAERNPENVLWQADLISGLLNHAKTLFHLMRVEEAIVVLKPAIALSQRLTASDPDNMSHQELLALCYRTIAGYHYVLDQFDKSEEFRKHALQVALILTGSTTQNSRWNFDRITDHIALTDYALTAARWEDAKAILTTLNEYVDFLVTENQPPEDLDGLRAFIQETTKLCDENLQVKSEETE